MKAIRNIPYGFPFVGRNVPSTPREVATAASYKDLKLFDFHPLQVYAVHRVPISHVRQAVIAEIQRMHEELKEPITRSYVADKYPNLLEWSRIAFTNWHIAVEQAGYNYETIQKEAKAQKEALELALSRMPKSGIKIYYLNGAETDHAKMQKFMSNFRRSNDLFSVTIDGTVLAIGTVPRTLNGATMGHTDIKGPTGLLCGDLSDPGTIQLSAKVQDDKQDPFINARRWNHCIRFGRFLIEYGFPPETKLGSGTIELLKSARMHGIEINNYFNLASMANLPLAL